MLMIASAIECNHGILQLYSLKCFMFQNGTWAIIIMIFIFLVDFRLPSSLPHASLSGPILQALLLRHFSPS